MESRRKSINFFVESGGKLRLLIPFLVLLLVSFAVIVILHKVTFTTPVPADRALSEADLALITYLDSLRLKTFAISAGGIVLLGLLTIYFWLTSAHRIFGPMVQIRRFVENLHEGKFDGKIRLRHNDEFKEIADSLNRLSAKFNEKESV